MSSKFPQRIILFILGMHRSGTSALTAAFRACGATTGENLLEPINSINKSGFWEDRFVVTLNESLLKHCDLDWYTITPDSHLEGISEEDYATGRAILEQGFGNGAVEVVKDPRFCVTLPFWIDLCHELEISFRICAIQRDNIEIAHSLKRRDGFPLSFGISLANNYQKQIDNIFLNYNSVSKIDYIQLVTNPIDSLNRLITEMALPLVTNRESLLTVIEPSLRHQVLSDEPMLLDTSLNSENKDIIKAFVSRGHELSELGTKHTLAVETVQIRDLQLKKLNKKLQSLGNQHEIALSTLQERDLQLKKLNKKLQSLGNQHEIALSTLQERDLQLQELNDKLESLGKQHEIALSTIDQRDSQLTLLQEQYQALGEQHGYALSIVEERDQQLASSQDSYLRQKNVLEKTREELAKIKAEDLINEHEIKNETIDLINYKSRIRKLLYYLGLKWPKR